MNVSLELYPQQSLKYLTLNKHKHIYILRSREYMSCVFFRLFFDTASTASILGVDHRLYCFGDLFYEDPNTPFAMVS